MGIKMSSKQFQLVYDGYVKYEEAEVDKLVAILKKNNCGGGAADRVEYSKQTASGCLLNTFYPPLPSLQ